MPRLSLAGALLGCMLVLAGGVQWLIEDRELLHFREGDVPVAPRGETLQQLLEGGRISAGFERGAAQRRAGEHEHAAEQRAGEAQSLHASAPQKS